MNLKNYNSVNQKIRIVKEMQRLRIGIGCDDGKSIYIIEHIVERRI